MNTKELTMVEEQALNIIRQAIEKDTVINSETFIAKIVENETPMNNKEFWAFSYNDDNNAKLDVKELIKSSLNNIKQRINEDVLQEYKKNDYETILPIEFLCSIGKIETIADYESTRRLVRGIIYYQLNS